VALQPPRVPILSNIDAALLTTVGQLRAELLDHICAPVQWVATVEAMLAAGVTRVIEVGPGRVLSGLIRRINRDVALGDAETLLG
jgi:[acyl-carrier-protein] S-malonyltransferase